eukprot:COSAG02_NODE_61_length_43452_cov_741.297804_2_plen_139_part_00
MVSQAGSRLRVCGGGVWRLLSFASGRGQGRLGVVSGLDRSLMSTFPSFNPEPRPEPVYYHYWYAKKPSGSGRSTESASFISEFCLGIPRILIHKSPTQPVRELSDGDDLSNMGILWVRLWCHNLGTSNLSLGSPSEQP